MKLSFLNAEKLLPGISCVLPLIRSEISADGVKVTTEVSDSPTLKVTCDGKNAKIVYQKKCGFFRALGLLVERFEKGETSFSVEEKPQFQMNGVMFDLCQGHAAFTQTKMKEIIGRLALMGLDTLMLYLEDNYEVEGEPYFGYMRPRYTKAQLRELDDYAFELGIEMIPCIQTLGHLSNALRWDIYGDITDEPNCLLIGEEKTYAFIEKLIKNAKEPFRTDKMHVGMDEAFGIGRGKYLTTKGYCSQKDLMKEHLSRVSEICRRYGVKPMMWSDMYFNSMQDYGTAAPVSQEMHDMVPEGMRAILWDYEIHTEKIFPNHLKLTENTVFAGGCWNWLGYCFNAKFTAKSIAYQLSMCKKYGIREVFLTVWGDNATESPLTLNLYGAQLFAEHGYAETFNAEKFKNRFAFCCDADADDFDRLTLVDDLLGRADSTDPIGYDVNMSKYFMWQDVLTGLFDYYAAKLPTAKHYADLRASLVGSAERNPGFAEEFGFYDSVCAVLEKKAGLGVRLTDAYRAGNKAELRAIADEIPGILSLAKTLREKHRALWNHLYQPFGWDVMDMRYGFLFNRLESAKFAVDRYLSGETDAIPELERERLPYNRRDEYPRCIIPFDRIATPSFVY